MPQITSLKSNPWCESKDNLTVAWLDYWPIATVQLNRPIRAILKSCLYFFGKIVIIVISKPNCYSNIVNIVAPLRFHPLDTHRHSIRKPSQCVLGVCLFAFTHFFPQ